ncbi:hypothetical protein CTRI78_v002475 [Colletotrichum trifolii]|uniref:Uncharacterized protein n=1 Tax=Colletotrichum trifolii TaxID=5466 RepID=A0A4R8RLL4_COLTR|nr:hypothetical protein CTRI78_v002475 [Colletotrichum trifolii]
MESGRYSTEDLLGIRDGQQALFTKKLQAKAKENETLADIMGHKHTLRHRKAHPFLSRASAEARKSSSADSDGSILSKAPIQIQPLTQPQIQTQASKAPQAPKAPQAQTQPQPQPEPEPKHVHQLDGQDAEADFDAPENLDRRSSLPDRKRKGFEQFYEAVRSPTHVRVTAGGRIVPNTLDPSHSSPISKSHKERFAADTNGIHPSFAQGFNGMPFMPGQPQPMLGPMPSAMPPGYPFMTHGAAPFGFAMPPPFAFAQPPVAGKLQVNGEEKRELQDDSMAGFPGIRSVTMPSYGGQWYCPPQPMMPMGYPGGSMIPQMAQLQQPQMGPAQVQMPQMAQAQAQMAQMPQMTQVVGFNHMGQPLYYPQPPTPARTFTTAVQSQPQQTQQPVSSIRPSIITKNQLGGLRASLKKAEAQLAYNRHQIDEKHMEEYARQLRADIEHFEIKLKGELALETSCQNASREHSKDKGEKTAPRDLSKDKVKEEKSARECSKAKGEKKDHSRKHSVLPVTAALAPVFQPRDGTPAHVKEERAFSGRFFGPIPANLEEAQKYISMAPPAPIDEQFSNFARDNKTLALPYLIGEAPFGMEPSPSLRDYTYHRSLTQDEEMAKHLFWTKAPEHLRKKFPKFDGKDFYASSPEKQDRPKPSDLPSMPNLPTGRPDQDFGFSLPTENMDPFAPLEPYRDGGEVKAARAASRERELKRATKSDNVTSPVRQRGTKLRPVAHFNSQGVASKDTSSTENIGETDSEKASFNSLVRAWSEKVTATATAAALPGAVTSTNAHGYLPQYSIGHAAASLSPAIVKAAGQVTRPPPSKTVERVEAALSLLTISDDRAENQPPLKTT